VFDHKERVDISYDLVQQGLPGKLKGTGRRPEMPAAGVGFVEAGLTRFLRRKAVPVMTRDGFL